MQKRRRGRGRRRCGLLESGGSPQLGRQWCRHQLLLLRTRALQQLQLVHEVPRPGLLLGPGHGRLHLGQGAECPLQDLLQAGVA